MSRLTYSEWIKLPTHQDRIKGYQELDAEDRFRARCTEVYDESNPLPKRKSPRIPKVIKRPTKEEYRKRWEFMYERVVYRHNKDKGMYDENMADLEKRLANYDDWPFPCDIIFEDDTFEK